MNPLNLLLIVSFIIQCSASSKAKSPKVKEAKIKKLAILTHIPIYLMYVMKKIPMKEDAIVSLDECSPNFDLITDWQSFERHSLKKAWRIMKGSTWKFFKRKH